MEASFTPLSLLLASKSVGNLAPLDFKCWLKCVRESGGSSQALLPELKPQLQSLWFTAWREPLGEVLDCFVWPKDGVK